MSTLWICIWIACGATGLAAGRYLAMATQPRRKYLEPQYNIVLEPDVEQLVQALEVLCEAEDEPKAGWSYPPVPSEN